MLKLIKDIIDSAKKSVFAILIAEPDDLPF